MLYLLYVSLSHPDLVSLAWQPYPCIEKGDAGERFGLTQGRLSTLAAACLLAGANVCAGGITSNVRQCQEKP